MVKKDIVLVGFGGHGKSVADTIERTEQYNIVGYTDIEEIIRGGRYEYLGSDDILLSLYERGVKCAFVSIGYVGKNNNRDRLYKAIKDIGYEIPVIVDPAAIVSETATIDEGTFVGKGAIVNAEAKIGKMCIINSKALIEHEVMVGDFSHVAVGANLCGHVKLGDHVMIGAGAILIQGSEVCNGTLIKAGEIVR